MIPQRLTRFDIAVCHHQRDRLKFAIVSPTQLDSTDPSEIEKKTQAFMDFHHAINPRTPVILFQLENLIEVGSPLYHCEDGSTLYHLPRMTYTFIDELIKETEFLLSYSLLSKIVNANKVYDSIFTILEKEWDDTGLLVIGRYTHETQKT